MKQKPKREEQLGGGGSSPGHSGEPEKMAGAYLPMRVPESWVLSEMDRAIETKSLRRLYAYFAHGDNPFIVGNWEVIALSVVSSWCMVNRRECGSIDLIVDWSGYTRGWLGRVHGGIRECLQLGALEMIKQNAGHSVGLTVKGHRILDVYHKMRSVVLQEFIDTYEKKIARQEAKKLARLLAA